MLKRNHARGAGLGNVPERSKISAAERVPMATDGVEIKPMVTSEIAIGAFTVEKYRLKVKDDLWATHMTAKLEHWDSKLCRIAYFLKTGRKMLKYYYEERMDVPQLKVCISRIPDLYEAELTLVREIQAKHFPEEIDLLLRIGIGDPDDQLELRR
jgi:hypothetical protein